MQFDSIFDRDQTMSVGGDLTIQRRYRAAHNIGWYRFVEYAGLANGQPEGDIVPYADVLFPFEDALQAEPPAVDEVEVRRTGEGHLIEETYHLDQHGIVSVSITDLDTGYRQSHQLGLAGSARL